MDKFTDLLAPEKVRDEILSIEGIDSCEYYPSKENMVFIVRIKGERYGGGIPYDSENIDKHKKEMIRDFKNFVNKG